MSGSIKLDQELQAEADAAMQRWALEDLEADEARFDAEDRQEHRIAATAAHDDGSDPYDQGDPYVGRLVGRPVPPFYAEL